MTNAGFSIKDKLADLVHEGNWKWPVEWYDLYPILNQIPCPILHANQIDKFLWTDWSGNRKEFSVSIVWDTIRLHNVEVPWAHIVWFPHCIPRHSFHLWLVMRKKLKTQDMLKQWDVGPSTDLNLLRCPLCKLVPDSHNHLFFECYFSLQVWSSVKHLAGMQDVSASWDDIVDYIQPISRSRKARSIVGRLLIAATSYYIWQERNCRLFKRNCRSTAQISDLIISNVRLKLFTFRFKKTSQVLRMLDAWNLPSSCVLNG